MSLNCEYCKKEFQSKSVLARHQKTAKYCIKLQQNINTNIESISYKCSFCSKTYTSNENLLKHSKNCLEKLKSIISEKEEIILDLEGEVAQLKEENRMIEIKTEKSMLEKQTKHLQSTVDEIAKQPRTTNNNKILITTPLDLSKESVKTAIDAGFSHEHLALGQKGVAQFAYNNILKDSDGKLKYVCTDPSRQIFQYKSNDGKIQKDIRATKLTKAILNGDIKQTSHKIAWDNMKDGNNEIFMEYTNYYQNIQGMEDDNTDFRKELSSLAIN